MSLSPDIESTPPPAVSSLRSRFEKLAADTASPSVKRPSSVHGLLAPEPLDARPRAMSGTHEPRPHDPPHSLRPAVSSSDLRGSSKRPAPAPPGRTSRAPSPAPLTASPLLRPATEPTSSPLVSDSSLLVDTGSVSVPLARSALVARKPPPPPPPLYHEPKPETKPESSADQKPSSVSSLINKFGNVPAAPPASPSKRVVSYSTAPPPHTLASGLSDLPRRPRHSFPVHSSSASGSSSVSSTFTPSSVTQPDPFGDSAFDSEGTVVADPPPLPSRKSTGPNRNGIHAQLDPSSEDVASGGSSRASSDSDVSAAHIAAPSAQPLSASRFVIPPPRPPPRHKTSTASSASSSTSSFTPPPLPARKGAAPPIEEPQRRPPLRQPMQEAEAGPSNPSTSPAERKTFGSHPPPPTRTIGLGDKLPPARRAQSGSSSESEDEEAKKVELLPDTTRASRQPPTVDCHNYAEFNIHVPAYTSAVAVSGHIVAVANHHHLWIYDLSVSDAPIWNLDSKDTGLDTKLTGFKVTALEFRPAAREGDRGCFLWLGTKDGHLLEFDVRTGAFVGTKPAVHAHTVTHMFRHARSMVTMDDTGKVLVFAPDADADEVRLAHTQPRVVRIAEKQEFAKLLGAQLWTSTRDPNAGGAVGTTARGPVVRVYDIFAPGGPGRSLLPTEHLGAITSGTILPSQAGQAYLGHEGGNISIWSLETDDGVPVCQEVVKVSSSDVLSLEGVNDKLWAGARNGIIVAYDVTPRPWVVTNRWMAHQKLPVLRLAVDTWSMEKLGRLNVYSIGRDERLRFWDGLLGMDWVDQELLKRESEFSSFRDMNVLIVSWNVDSAKPDQLTGTAENVNFLQDVLTSVNSPDVIAFGLQELVDLESRRMAAKTVLLGGKNKTADGTISQKVTTSYKKWYDHLVSAVRLAMPADAPYTVIHTENLVGLFSCIFVKNAERVSLKQVAITTIKRGMGGRYGNKGGIVARFVIDDTSICFINCHLAAGQRHVRQRNADVAAFVEDKSVFPESDAIDESLAYVNGGDGSMVLDHEIVFMNGDMNYRIDQRRENVFATIKAGDLESLYAHDQLLKEMKHNRAFRLRSFTEGPLTFAPTYKYDRRSSEYDSSEKSRIPAWCDRVLWRSREPSRVEQLHYRRYEANISDHRPISAGFRMTVKSVRHEVREKIKGEMQAAWTQHEHVLLRTAHQFYIDQAMI